MQQAAERYSGCPHAKKLSEVSLKDLFRKGFELANKVFELVDEKERDELMRIIRQYNQRYEHNQQIIPNKGE